MGYIRPSVTTDADALAKAMLQYLADNIPGWVPNDQSLTSWLIYAQAFALAQSRDVASIVFDDIFTYFGQTVENIPPIVATPASVTVTVTMVDDHGYTLPTGTHLGFPDGAGSFVMFVLTSDVVVPAGSVTSAPFTAVAVDAGTAGNGFGPSVMALIDTFAFVSHVDATAASSGGVDAEATSTYLDRLTEQLTLVGARPILPNDYAILARTQAGVFRAVGIDGYNPALTVADALVTAGSQLINSATADFDAADFGRTVVTANVAGGTTVDAVNSPTQIHVSAAATAGDGVTPQALTLNAETGQEKTIAVGVVDQNGAALSQGVKDAVAAYLRSLREINAEINVIDPTVTNVAVVFEVHVKAGFDPTLVVSAAETAVSAFINPATWGGGTDSPPTWDASANTVRYLDVAAVLYDVAGVDHVVALTLNGSAADVALTGEAPLADASPAPVGTHD